MTTKKWVNVGSGLLSEGTKQFPEAVLTSHYMALWHSLDNSFTASGSADSLYNDHTLLYIFTIMVVVTYHKTIRPNSHIWFWISCIENYRLSCWKCWKKSLQYHNGCDGVPNHQPHDCLLNSLFRRRSKKTSKLRVTGLCVGNSPVTGEFPAQKASNAENVSRCMRYMYVGASFTASWLLRG